MGDSEAVEQFLVLYKSAEGKSIELLIKELVAHESIFSFGKFLEQPKILSLQGSDVEGQKHFDLLRLFAFGTYKDYMSEMNKYPVLTPKMIRKLRMLTLLSIAATTRQIEFKVIQEECGVSDLEEMENLVLDSIMAGIMNGRLSHSKNSFLVSFSSSRDVTIDNSERMLMDLQKLLDKAKTTRLLVASHIEKIEQAHN